MFKTFSWILLLFLVGFMAFTIADDNNMSMCNCDDEGSFWSFEIILETQKVGDFLIAIAYFSIPIELVYFVSRSNVPLLYNWVVCEFIGFIVLCGMTHFLAGFTYGPHRAWLATAVTVFKMLTGIVSILTALSLVTLFPLLLKAKVREFMLSKKARELDREVGIIMKQRETGLHVRMLTGKIRKSLDRHTILYTTLVELSKTLGLKNCAVWIPNEVKTEMNLTHELKPRNEETLGRFGNGFGSECSIPITDSDVVKIKRSEEVNMLSSCSALASITSRGNPGPTVGIRVPMLRVCNFKGGPPEAIHMCYAILVCVLPVGNSRNWAQEELEIVKVVADQVAVAISHAVILEESQLMRDKLAEQNRILQIERENALRASQTKTAFEHLMSDTMRNPMRCILDSLPLIQDGTLPENQKIIVDAMVRTSNLLLQLVDNAGEVTGGGIRAADLCSFSLRSVVKEAACLAKCLCIKNGLGYLTEVDRTLPDYVVGDDRKVFQVILHMLGGLMSRNVGGTVIFRVLVENGNSKERKDNREAVWRQNYSNEFIEVRFEFEIDLGDETSSRSSSLDEEFPTFDICENIVKVMQGSIQVVQDSQDSAKSLSVVLRFQLRRSLLSWPPGYSGEASKTSTPSSSM